jgi:hypothetical protein
VTPPGAYYLFVNRQNPAGLTPSVARVVFVGDRHDGAEAFQPFPDEFAGVTGGSATALAASPHGGETYLGPAGTAANQAAAGTTPTVAAVEDRTARLDLTAVPVSGQPAWLARRPVRPNLLL